MLAELERSKTDASYVKKVRLLESLIKLYEGPNLRYINFYGPPRTVTTIPYYQALQLGKGRLKARQPDLKGKAVFVGLSEQLLADRKDSFYTVFSQANGLFISGVEIMASAWSNIMDDTPCETRRLINLFHDYSGLGSSHGHLLPDVSA